MRVPVVAAVVATLALAACDSAEELRGRQLFAGEQPLSARIAGHDTTLPAHATRCINCHADANANGVAPSGAPASAQPYATRLSRDSLASLRSRRGGPPSRFDAASLCRLLRTGVDPAHVVIPRSMPRYELTDVDCGALWAYLSAKA